MSIKNGHIGSYASGNGALSVGRYKEYEYQKFTMTYNVTLDEVKEYRDQNFPEHKVFEQWGNFYLVTLFERLNDKQLKDKDGHVYTYEGYNPKRDFTHDMIVTLNHPELGMIEVKNWGILASIRFFLHNEKYFDTMGLF